MFAGNGYNLVLVARRKERLGKLADGLKKEFGILVKVIPKDLSVPSSPKEIFDELLEESIHVDVLVNNAGFGAYGPFSETNLKRELDMIQVNLVSLTELTRLFLPEMLERGRGRILNVASIVVFAPGPFYAVYGATKAYVLSLSEAIAAEFEGTGVTVTALCPGGTKTEFYKIAQREDIVKSSPIMDAKTVAQIGYHGLMEGKRVVIPGTLNKLFKFLSTIVPRKVIVKIIKNKMESPKNEKFR